MEVVCLIQATNSELGVQDRVPVLLAEALFHDDWPSQKMAFPYFLHKPVQRRVTEIIVPWGTLYTNLTASAP